MIIIYFSVIITDEIEVFIIYLSSYTYVMRKIFLLKIILIDCNMAAKKTHQIILLNVTKNIKTKTNFLFWNHSLFIFFNTLITRIFIIFFELRDKITFKLAFWFFLLEHLVFKTEKTSVLCFKFKKFKLKNNSWE